MGKKIAAVKGYKDERGRVNVNNESLVNGTQKGT